MKTKIRFLRCATMLAVVFAPLASAAAQQPETNSAKRVFESRLHHAARTDDIPAMRAELQAGTNPDVPDALGRTPLMDAVASGRIEAIITLLKAGAKVNVRAHDNRTPLLEAASDGQLEAAAALIDAGADLGTPERGWGTPLETAERAGNTKLADLLRATGARSSGRSPGNTICVRPWHGDGYCGTVMSVDKTKYYLRITRLVGCQNGCPARSECSAGRPVGGPGGLAVGDDLDTVSWCLTDTGLNP